jgi:hypothetical protein
MTPIQPQPPVPEKHEPSKSGYGHPPNTSGRTRPQGGDNAIGPDDENHGTTREPPHDPQRDPRAQEERGKPRR